MSPVLDIILNRVCCQDAGKFEVSNTCCRYSIKMIVKQHFYIWTFILRQHRRPQLSSKASASTLRGVLQSENAECPGNPARPLKHPNIPEYFAEKCCNFFRLRGCTQHILKLNWVTVQFSKRFNPRISSNICSAPLFRLSVMCSRRTFRLVVRK